MWNSCRVFFPTLAHRNSKNEIRHKKMGRRWEEWISKEVQQAEKKMSHDLTVDRASRPPEWLLPKQWVNYLRYLTHTYNPSHTPGGYSIRCIMTPSTHVRTPGPRVAHALCSTAFVRTAESPVGWHAIFRTHLLLQENVDNTNNIQPHATRMELRLITNVHIVS